LCIGTHLPAGEKFKNEHQDIYMDIERIEKLLGVKVVNIETMKGRVFPLFDLTEVKGIRKGIRLALIANPSFLIIDEEDVREKKVEGEFVVVQKEDDEYLLIKYTGTPNIEALHEAEAEQKEEVEKQEAEEDKGGDGDDDPVKEILRKLPKWSDGAVVIEKDGIVVLPVKRSTKKDGFYASTTWKPLEVRGAEELIGHLITRNGKVIRVSIYTGNKYINIYTNRPRRGGKYYSGRRQ
jgi:hypothetical protein